MKDPAETHEKIESTLDLRLGEVLDEYLQQVEKGNSVSREELLSKHPDLADRLAACLDGIDLFRHPQSPEQQANLESAPVVGDYEIIRELGRGGMGVVYEAREKSLDRIVALKVMRFGIVDPRALERFQREAETAGALHHTNIVPVYATGREGDTSWYAMQRIVGESLSQRIHRAYREKPAIPVANEEIVDVGLQAAEALDHAHQRDVIHRDVKPGNLIVDGEGRVWLTDFGLARRLVDVGATMTGALLGTPRYMSPEQADMARVDVDHRSDIYSLGATLYELATGRPPFEGDDPLGVISKIRFEEPPSPKSIRPNISRELDVVLMKCLAKDSNRRYSTAAELADDLRAIRDDRPIRAKPTSIFEHLARWSRKHQAGMRAAGFATMATVLIGMLASLGLENWREQSQSAFRLRAAGGPYSTTIQSADLDGSSVDPMSLTVPMQSFQKLPHGDYDVMLSARSRWSQKVRLPIQPGADTEFSVRSQEPPVREIPIKNAFAASTAGFDGPAVISSHDGKLRRYAFDEANDWTLDATKIETRVVLIDPENNVVEKSEAESADSETIEIDFSAHPPLNNTSWLRARFHENPQIACPARTLQTAIDLNADKQADTVVAAMGSSALMAVDASGDILWANAYDLNGRLRDGNPTTLKRPIEHVLPGIVDIHDVGDRNDDGVSDLVVQMVHIQPGIQNDVCLALLNGKTGDVLVAVKPPALKVPERTEWTWDGQLRYANVVGGRTTGSMKFSEYRVRIDNSYNHVKTQHRTSGSSTFALPSPIRVTEASGKLLAIYAASDTCQVYDLEAGKLLGTPIKLGGRMAARPKLVRLGRENDEMQWGLLIYEAHRPHTTKAGKIIGSRYAVYELGGKLVWDQIRESPEFGRSTAYPAKVDWPLVSDVNNDGRDEILVPAGVHIRSLRTRQNQLALLDASNGNDLWNLENAYHYDLNRLALTADIDNDGTRDFVCASVNGSSPIELIPGTSTEIGLASVYVDWISGADGHSIMWASHSVATAPREIGRAEIDAIRCQLAGLDPSIVEVDFVGGSMTETEMDSMTIQFSPRSHDAVSVASGVTLCASKQSDNANARIFYRRPGPFLDGDETLIFLRDRQPATIRLGESEIVATWTTQTTDATGSQKVRKFAGVKGLLPERLSIIDVDRQKTLWSTQTNASDNAAFYPIRYPDGSYDFLISQPFYNSAPQLLDGDTGRSYWTMSAEPRGGILYATTVTAPGQPDRLLIVGNGNSHSAENKQLETLQMSMLNAANGRVLWSKQFLHGARRRNRPGSLNDIQFADVNGDGITDVIGPEQLEDEDEVRIAVWDGKQGDRLWMTEPLKGGVQSRYFPGPFVTFQVQGRPRIAYLVRADGNTDQYADSRPTNLVIRNATNGEVLTSTTLPDGMEHLFATKRRSTESTGAMAVSSGSEEVNLYLASNWRNTLQHVIVDISDDEVSFRNVHTDEEKYRTRSIWFKDVTGDTTVELLVLKRDALECREVLTNNLIWKLDLRDEYHRSLTINESSPTAWVHDSPNLNRTNPSAGPPVNLIDLASGEVIGEFEAKTIADKKMRAITGNGDTSLLWPSKSGTRVQKLVGDDVPQLSAVEPTRADPRRVGYYRFSQHGRSIQDIVFTGIRSTLILLAFVLPFFYVGTMVVQRRWSLSFFLLAPLVALLFVMVVRTSWFGFITLHDGYRWLATPLGLWWIMRTPTNNEGVPMYTNRGKWIFLALLVVISFVSLIYTERIFSDEMLIYHVGLREVLFGIITVFGYAFRYWFGFLFIWLLWSLVSKKIKPSSSETPIGAKA